MIFKLDFFEICKCMAYPLYTLLVGLILFLIYPTSENSVTSNFILGSTIGILLLVGYLFFEHLYHGLGLKVTFEAGNVIIKNKNDVIHFEFYEIHSVELYASQALFSSSTILFLPWESLYFAKLIFNDGSYCYLTSLTSFRLYSKIRRKHELRKKLVKKKTLFSSILYHELE